MRYPIRVGFLFGRNEHRFNNNSVSDPFRSRKMATSSASPYSYTALGKGEIRLLKLGTGVDESPIASLRTATIRNFQLGHSGCPPFRALSYVWGDTSARWSLRVDGQDLPVLHSLQEFVEFIRDKKGLGTSWWWIDSICINSKDVDERGSQIQHMGDIYRASKETVIWLGPEEDDSGSAIDFLHHLAKMRHGTSRTNKKEQSAIMAAKFLTEQYASKWTALEKFFRRPWWSRVWTLQEFILSKQVIFYCGSSILTRRTLASGLFATWLCNFTADLPVDKTAWSSAWARRRLFQWFQYSGERNNGQSGSIPLVAMLSYFTDQNASDDHDRIYSLLGIATDSTKLVPEIKYRESILQTYANFTRRYITEYQDLDIICFGQIFRDESCQFPSWVPDWRYKAYPQVVPMMVSQSGPTNNIGNLRPLHLQAATIFYKASGSIRPKIQFGPNHQLLCEGVLLDRITGISACISIKPNEGQIAPMIQSTKSTKKIREAIDFDVGFNLLHAICQSLVLGRQDRYLCQPSPSQSFIVDFATFCINSLNDRSSVHPLFGEWYAASKALQIGPYTLEELTIGVCAQMPQVPIDLHDTSDWESFLSRFCDTTIKMSRRLIVSKKGLVGMAPLQSEKDDLICILYGCSVPVLLRQKGPTNEYELVGECYVDGYMNGQILVDLEGSTESQPALCTQTFTIV
jgi:hypothetical protein